jgi:hypothetical protein
MEFGRVFVTASRDKCVKIWGGEEWGCVSTVKFPEAVTACAFLHTLVDDNAYIAIGLENGRMYILGCKRGSHDWKITVTFDERY